MIRRLFPQRKKPQVRKWRGWTRDQLQSAFGSDLTRKVWHLYPRIVAMRYTDTVAMRRGVEHHGELSLRGHIGEGEEKVVVVGTIKHQPHIESLGWLDAAQDDDTRLPVISATVSVPHVEFFSSDFAATPNRARDEERRLLQFWIARSFVGQPQR